MPGLATAKLFSSPEQKILADHFAQKQKKRLSNISVIQDDEGWLALEERLRGACGGFVFWRRQKCGGSRSMTSLVYDFSCENEEAPIVFAEVDLDSCPAAAAKYEVTLTPCFTAFAHGSVVSHFHGVSKAAYFDAINSFMEYVDCCSTCGRNQRLKFLADVPMAIESGTLLSGAGLSSAHAGSIPDGRCVADDIRVLTETSAGEELLGSLKLRAEHLRNQVTHHSQTDPTIDAFLSEVTDEGMPTAQFHQRVDSWLTSHLGRHPSLWSKEHFIVRKHLLRAATSRRAARVELWLLENLLGASTGTTRCKDAEHSAWKDLALQLSHLQKASQTCSHGCPSCRLPCMKPAGHSGSHDCNTDHSCHCAANHGFCVLPAGHEEVHRFPPAPASQAPRIPTCSHSSGSSKLPPILRSISISKDAGGDDASPALAGHYEDVCAICLEPFAEEEEGNETLTCKHVFHRSCIAQWISKRTGCPLCRGPVQLRSPALSQDARVQSLPALQGNNSARGVVVSRDAVRDGSATGLSAGTRRSSATGQPSSQGRQRSSSAAGGRSRSQANVRTQGSRRPRT